MRSILRVTCLLSLIATATNTWGNDLELSEITPEEFTEISALMRELGKIDRRDLFVPVARLQLHYVLNALESGDFSEERKIEVKKFARGIAFNIASFTWPGWDDTPNITYEMVERGVEAGAIGLKLAEEINDVTPNILWINGVHALNAGEFNQAKTYFERAKGKAADKLHTEMHRLWIVLTNHLEHQTAKSLAEYQKVLDDYRSSWQDEGRFFADQVETAHKVFSRN